MEPSPAAWRPIDARIAAAEAAMMANPERALLEAQTAFRLATPQPPSSRRTIALATAQWLQGDALLRLNQPEKADPVLAAARRSAEANAPRTKLHAEVLRSSGTVATMLGRVQEALQDFHAAHRIFQAIGDDRGQAKTLINIGSIYNDAGDWERMLQYQAQAADTYGADPAITVAARNSRGNAFRALHRLGEAQTEYRRAFTAAEQLGSPLLEARILTNLASAQEQAGRLNEAEINVERGLRIAADETAAGWRPFLWGVKAQIAFKRGDLATAKQLIARTFQGVDLARTTMPYREFHDFAHQLYARTGEQSLALAHLEAFKRLDDENRTLAASTNAALMAARFDFANQDLRIAKLKTGQLERDVLLARSKARLHTIVTAGLGGTALVIVVLLSIGYFSIRRSRNEVRAANEQLSTTNVQLEKALKAKTEFLATTSHEIRTPLNGILGMTQVILHDNAIAGPLRERIEVVHGAGETMKALVDDLLDVAKMETGKLVIDRSEMDLQSVLDAAIRLWSGPAKAKNLALALDCPERIGRIIEDETRLRQILFNLLSNAIKFTERGAVRLEVTSAPAEEGDGELLRIRVEDTGIGIPEDQLERIFEPFHQVDGGVTRRYGGTGLGLAICRNLTDAMDGKISVVSELDEGSTFTVTLPLHRVSGSRAAPLKGSPDGSADMQPHSLAACRLLLIERNPLAQSILRAVLEPEVAALDMADSGEDALSLLAGGQFDEVVVDGASAVTGTLDRTESVREIARAAAGATVTVLWPDLVERDREALEAAGADAILAKPIAAKALLDALKSRRGAQFAGKPAESVGCNPCKSAA